MGLNNRMLPLLLFLRLVATQDLGPVTCLDFESGACFHGSYGLTSSGRQYASYQGIRYAEPPTGNQRFLAPKPYRQEEGLWDVSNESTIICPTKSNWYDPDWDVLGQEDCLFLNVYSPKNHQNHPLPVMVWIHGGALVIGSGTYQEHGPQHLLDKEVIVVTINYRLGVLGFLCLGSDLVAGNAGLRDQALALHWVAENIVHFGGDPDRVTIFGESAGSSSVSLQLLSPLSKGTFQRAILQSGTALGISWGAPNTPEKALEYAAVVSQATGCNDSTSALTCLQELDVKSLVGHTDLFADQTGFPWQAVPDSSFTSTPFLPAPAEDILQSGQFNADVEVIVGTCKDEGLGQFIAAWSDPEFFDNLQTNWDTVGVATVLGLTRVSDITPEDVEDARNLLQFYVGGVENMTQHQLQSLVDMMTDSSFLYGVHKKIGYLLRQNVTVYQYVLTHRGGFSITQMNGPSETHGVSHADDLIYEWDPVFGPGWDTAAHQISGEDALVRELLTGAWASFASTGVPLEGVWEPVVDWKENLLSNFLNISGSHPEMADGEDLGPGRMDIWNSVVG